MVPTENRKLNTEHPPPFHHASRITPLLHPSKPMTETILQSYPQVRGLDPTSSSRRNGKIARLPKTNRDMINKMLDDGLPYHVIIDELGEAGEGLNTQNLTNWK